MIVLARMFYNPMIHHVGMGKALSCMVAMAEGKRSRRHDKAKCREGCDNHAELEAEAGRKRSQHGFRLVVDPATY